ncbi:MAG: radical SAM protein [Candidatus Omnitrophota bacterium]|nr:radical SAM protein [Candidatus Omnitrophota bacterium]
MLTLRHGGIKLKNNMGHKHGIDFKYVERLKHKRLPLIGDFELTEMCNLRCVHCCVRSDKIDPSHKELNTKEVLNILGQMRRAGIVYLNLTGGEPLLRPDFKDIYLFAKKKNFAITVITNGTLITKEMVEFFKKYPPLMLEISNYGITADIYESVTRMPGSFAMFQKALDMLKGSGVRFKVRVVVMKENYNEIIRKRKTIKASGMNCGLALPLILRRDRDRVKNEIIKKQRLSVKEVMEFFRKFPKDNIEARKKRYSYFRYVDSCNCHTLGCTVLPNGALSMCHLIKKSKFNLRNVSFMEAWNSSYNGGLLSSRQDMACGNCEHKVYCKWCPGIAYLETGSTKAKIPYLCQVMKMLCEKGG